MAQVVSYNPQTGAKLSSGQSVVVNGKTFTQGSTNIYGSGSSSQTGGSTNTPTKKTAFIPLRNGGGSSFASANSTPTKAKTTPKANQSNFEGSYAQTTGYKKDAINTPQIIQSQSGILGNINSYLSNIFKSVGSNSQGASALNSINNANPYTPPVNINTAYTSNGAPMSVASPKKQTLASDIPNSTPYQGSYAQTTPQAYTAPFTDASTKPQGQVLGAFLNNSTYNDTPTTTEKKTVTNPDGTTSEITTSGPTVPPPVVVNPQVDARLGVASDNYSNSKTTPFDSNQTKESFQTNKVATYQNDVARSLNDPQEVYNNYNASPTFKQSIDKVAQDSGKTPQEILTGIASKVQPVTNGITPSQDTASYLNAINVNKAPKAIRAEASAINDAAVQNSIYNSQEDKLAHDFLEQQKNQNALQVEHWNRQEARQEASQRERAQYMIEKQRAEFNVRDAEIEQQRIQAKTNLTEFLAHIGALSTDGAANLGLANLDQRYQAQRSQLRSSFDLAVTDINLNLNDKLTDLQDRLDDNVIKLNSDLSKSEREITLNSLKLNHDTQKEMIAARLKYATLLRQESDKNEARANSLAKDWTTAFFTTAAGNNAADLFKSLPKEFQQSWLQNNPVPTNGTRTTLPDLSKDYSEFSKNQPKDIGITETTMQKVRQYLKSEDKKNYEENLAAFNSDPEFRNSILGSIQ